MSMMSLLTKSYLKTSFLAYEKLVSVQPTDTTDTVKCTTDRVVPTTDIVMR